MKTAFLLLLSVSLAGAVLAQPVDILPIRTPVSSQPLNGEWKFKYFDSSSVGVDETFYQPRFDVDGWSKIVVPSNWELQGFTEPQYNDDVKEGTGLYRRTFKLPKQWSGQRVFLRFDGVLYGYTVWVNGKSVGEWASSYNPATFDITDALDKGEVENIVAVRVTTRSKGWNFDNMDCWALSGIFRDVTLFALPQTHFRDYTVRTSLGLDGSAEVQLEVATSGGKQVSGRLLSPDGKAVTPFRFDLSSEFSGSVKLTVEKPQLWTAETPLLYTLELDLQSEGKPVQRHSTRIGIRQVTIEEGILKLNGRAIKLRGVNHHDIWPEGRIATEENMRRDLELMRDANINFVRTSHYPPHPRFLELCDEMGFYVNDEVPYVHGRKHLKDPDFQEVLYTRARATVTRDKNHPSVIFWSLGNENPVTELGNNTGRYVKKLDPTRPFTFPTIGRDFDGYLGKFPSEMEIYAPHYPSLKQTKEFADKLDKPIIFTEYAHQRGLARSGTGVQELWDQFYKSPRIAGGAIWVFQDQGLLRTTKDFAAVKDGDLMAWLDTKRYYDTRGFYAMDGLVYSDRTPQVDYWQVRKVYSPVQIREESLPISPGKQVLKVSAENRFDFRSLSGIKLKWSLRRNRTSIQDGTVALSAKSKDTEELAIPVTLPDDLSTDMFTLDLLCVEESGRQFYERTIKLAHGSLRDTKLTGGLASPAASKPNLEVSEAVISVQHPAVEARLNRQSGKFELFGAGGVLLASEFGPHMGRNPTINDMAKNREREPELWRWSLMREVKELQTSAEQLPGGVRIVVRGIYPRPNKPDESIAGEYRLLITPEGSIDVSYDYKPLKATGEVLEAGFGIAAPNALSEFRWIGEGPYSGYPGKTRLNEFGAFHLNREDLYFPGNRRGVDLAILCSPSGTGILVEGSGMTVDLEAGEEQTVISHLALVPGERSTNDGVGENVDVSSRLKAGSIKGISGKFTLLPLGKEWPVVLTKWLGKPDEKVNPVKPFLRSYDR